MPRRVNDEDLVRTALRKRLRFASGDKVAVAEFLAVANALLEPHKAPVLRTLEALEKKIEDLQAQVASLTAFMQARRPKQVGEIKFGGV